MAMMNDPYDPDEIRRRQLLAASMDSPPPTATGQAPDVTASVLAPGVEDQETDATAAGAGKLTPAMQKYRATVESMPLQENYAPSKWRRFGAAVAGGLAGMKDAGQGIKTAQGILEAPHAEAQQDWASRVNREALSMGLDEKAAARDIAQQRASAAQMSAKARADYAAKQMAEIDRKAKLPQEYKPTTREEYEGQLHIIHPGRAPTLAEEYKKDPATMRQMWKDQSEGKVLPDSYYKARFDERMRLQDSNNAARMRLHTTPGAPPFERPPFLDAQEQSRTEELAARQAARLNPAYDKFIDPGDGTPAKPFRIKRLEEITDPKDRLMFNNFMTDVGAQKRRSYGVRRIVQGSSPWVDVQEE